MIKRFPALSLALTLFVVIGSGACGKGGDSVIDSLSEQDRNHVESDLTMLGNKVGFDILFPDYLPAGIDPLPLTSTFPDNDIATLVFESSETAGSSTPLFIMLYEYDRSQENLTCETLHLIPLKPEYTCRDITLEEGPAVSQISVTGPEQITHTVKGNKSGQLIDVSITWPGNPREGEPAELSDDRVKVALDVFRSLSFLSSE